MRGFFAVLYETYEGGFSEPINTGMGSYATREEAIPEARDWAEAEDVPVDFDPPAETSPAAAS